MSDVPTRIGPYAIESRLGAGGMAETFVARRNMQGVEQRVCVKRILPAYARDATARRLFLREANISAGLRHANLVTILDVGEDAGAPYLVMELVEGADLGAILERAPGNKLPPELVAFVLAEMAHGLHEAHGGGGAHAGVVHRDLSPSNVLISTMGEVKVADFGIAKALSGEKATATMMRGKFAYMAPEQLDGAPLDPRADIFALGVMGYEMVAGVRPFDAEHDARLVLLIAKNERRPVYEVAPGAPKDLLDTIEALLAPKKDERPVDGHAVVERLAPVLPSAMVARRKMGILAKAALQARLSASADEDASPEEGELPAFAPTMSVDDAKTAEVETPETRESEAARAQRAGDVSSLPTQSGPPIVESIGTSPSLADRLAPATVPEIGRSPVAMIALAAVAILALVGGGVLVASTSAPAIDGAGDEAPQGPTPVAASPTPAPVSPATSTTPITVPTPAPIPEPPAVDTVPPVMGSEPQATTETTHATATTATTHGTHPAPETATTPVTAGAAETEPVEAPADPAASATLEMVVSPWGNIWVDHRFLGRAPVSVPVTPGSHVVQAGFTSPQSRRSVRVRAHQHERVEFELSEPEPGAAP